MIIEYDDEDRCIRVDGEAISYRIALGLIEDLEQAINEWDRDHNEPDGHYDD